MVRPDVTGEVTMLSAEDFDDIFGWCSARSRTGLPGTASPTTPTAAVAQPSALELATAILDAAAAVLEQVQSTPPGWLVDVVLAKRESGVKEEQVEAEFSRAALAVLRDVLAVTA